MKKVLIVVPSLGGGGQERIAANMAQCLRKYYEVEIVVFQSKPDEYQTDAKVCNLDIPAQPTRIRKIIAQLRRARALKELRKRIEADIVYSLGMTANLANVLSSFGSNGKTIVSLHGFAEVRRSVFHKFVFQFADRIVCIAHEMEHQLLLIYPRLRSTVVIENGYDLEKTIDNPPPKREYDKSAPRLIAMGRLEEVKRYELLLKAFVLISNSFTGATLSFLGDGSKRTELHNLTRSLGINHKVVFLGYQSSPYETLKKNDILVLTSKSEGFPNALIEGMACGLVVVSIDCLSGPREILSGYYDAKPISGICFEKYGVLIENLTDEQQLTALFADAVVQLCTQPKLVNSYQERGRTRAGEFSQEVFGNKLHVLFESITRKTSD